MTPDPERDRKRLELIHAYRIITEVTSALQNDMVEVLLTDPANRKTLKAQLAKSENWMEQTMNDASHAFIAKMPLASMNRTNLFTRTMAFHSNLTGDPIMHEVFETLNAEVLDQIDEP